MLISGSRSFSVRRKEVTNMTLDIYLAFLVAATVLIIIPGPTNMVVVSSAMKAGFRQSLWTISGAAVSHAFFFSITSLGLATLLIASARFFEWLRWIGAGYLVWLGLRYWMASHVPREPRSARTAGRALSLFLQGFTVNTTNPKALVFYTAFFPPFINLRASVGPQLFLLGMTFVTIFISVAMAHAYGATRARELFRSPSLIRLQNRIAGSLLIGAGVFLALTYRR